jgi:hypothetical protein
MGHNRQIRCCETLEMSRELSREESNAKFLTPGLLRFRPDEVGRGNLWLARSNCILPGRKESEGQTSVNDEASNPPVEGPDVY